MKNLVSLFAFVFLLFGACTNGNDFCSVDDHIGTWKGTSSCSGDVEENTILTVFQNSDGTILTRISGIVLPTTLSNCEISASGASGFGDSKTDYSVTGQIEDEMLTVTYTKSGAQSNTCLGTLTKE